MALRNKLSEEGYTIVELLVTIVVGAILVTSTNSILTTHSYISQRTRDLVVANSYVDGKFEAMRSAGFLALSDGTTSITSELPSELNTPRSGTMTIGSLSPGIKQIDITITFNEQGNARTYTYRTYMGEIGVGQY